MNHNLPKSAINFTNPSLSYWIASIEQPNYPSLEKDIEVDVAIVGGGITGITSAFLLKRAGLKVAVIEASNILQGTTAHTTAKLTSQHHLIYDKLKKQMGDAKAQQYADANQAAIEFVANIVREKNIDCDFSRQQAFVYTQKDEFIENIQDEINAALSLGIKASFQKDLPLSLPIKGAMCFDNQAQFHPRKYLLALSEEIPGHGSHIFENTRAIGIDEGEICSVTTQQEKRVSAKNIIIASHFPFYDGIGLYFSRIYPERSYALGIKTQEKFPGGMYISAENPSRSLRSQPSKDGELIIVVGESHKTGQGEDTSNHYANLFHFSEEIFQVLDTPYRWSTQDYTSMDEVPYIGKLTSRTSNIYVATGFRKWGMSNGTAAAIILKDLITKGDNPWEAVYNPSRFTPAASAKNFVKENFNVAKNLILGKLESLPDNVKVSKGEGKAFSVDGQKIGAFRDEHGKLHLVDTTCTHMGCELQWNSAERSWDCPCHGSRFTYQGEILEGPALKTLKYNTI